GGGLGQGVDVGGEGRLGDDAPAPDRLQQVILANDVLGVLDEVEQQVEDLWPDGDGFGLAGQLPPIGVECIVSEQIVHFRAPSPGSMSPVSSAKPLIAQRPLRGTPCRLLAAWTEKQGNYKIITRTL